jgi:hypothetical protein
MTRLAGERLRRHAAVLRALQQRTPEAHDMPAAYRHAVILLAARRRYRRAVAGLHRGGWLW